MGAQEATQTGAIPVGVIPPELIPVGATAAGSIPVGATAAGSIPVGVIPVGVPVEAIPVGATAEGSIPVGLVRDLALEVIWEVAAAAAMAQLFMAEAWVLGLIHATVRWSSFWAAARARPMHRPFLEPLRSRLFLALRRFRRIRRLRRVRLFLAPRRFRRFRRSRFARRASLRPTRSTARALLCLWGLAAVGWCFSSTCLP